MSDQITAIEGLDTLQATFNGQVILPGDPGYDERREHFNRMHDKRPAVIVVPSGTADVVAAVKFARAADLEIAVSSGGKHPSGFSRTDDGIVIDLSGMRSVKVDPETQTAWVQGGADGGDLQAEALVHGLGGASGWMRATGIAGVTLNGGGGPFTPKLGMGVDTIIEMELVTPEGEVLRVSPEENPDLFWALRGAAPNFGIVTWLKQRLCAVPDEVLAGFIFYSFEDGPKLFGMLDDYVLNSSEDLSLVAFYTQIPDLEDYPEEIRGKAAAAVTLVHIGDPEQAQKDVQPLRDLGPAADFLAPQGYFDFMCSMDEFLVPSRMIFETVDVGPLSEKVIEILGRTATRLDETGLRGEITVWPLSWRREPEHPNAFPLAPPGELTSQILAEVYWDDPADDERAAAWAESLTAELRSEGVALDGVHTNMVSAVDVERDQRSYGEERWKRLTELKAKYDPENAFHLNHNIPPA